MKNPFIRLREMENFLGGTEKAAAKYLLENPNDVLENNIHTLAKKMYVSSATIIRLCKKIGFDGYRDFKEAVIFELALYKGTEKYDDQVVHEGDSLERIVKKVAQNSVQAISETNRLVDLENPAKVVDVIDNSKNLYFFGLGSSQLVAHDAYLKFLRIAKPSFNDADWNTQLIHARNTTSSDCGIIISYSGESPEMVACMDALNEKGATSILITRFAPSTLSRKAAYVLYTSAAESLFRSGATASRIAQLEIVDILFSAYASRHYEEVLSCLHRTHITKPNT